MPASFERLVPGPRGPHVGEVAHHLPAVEAGVVDVDRRRPRARASRPPTSAGCQSREAHPPAGGSLARSCRPDLAQLWLVDRGRGAGERVGARGGLGEGDHVADRVRRRRGAGRCDRGRRRCHRAAARRSAAPRAGSRSAPRLRPVDPQRGEDLALQAGVADADRAAAHLLAVPDQVVGLGARARRDSPGRSPPDGAVNGMVQRIPAPLVVRLHQRPVDDPEQVDRSPSGIRPNSAARSSRSWASTALATLGLSATTSSRSPSSAPSRSLSALSSSAREELRRRRAPAVALAEGPDEPLGAELLGAGDQAVERRARHLAAAGVDAAHRAAALDHRARRP